MVRQGSAKALCVGSIPTLASNSKQLNCMELERRKAWYSTNSSTIRSPPENPLSARRPPLQCSVTLEARTALPSEIMKTEMKQRYRKFKRGWGVIMCSITPPACPSASTPATSRKPTFSFTRRTKRPRSLTIQQLTGSKAGIRLPIIARPLHQKDQGVTSHNSTIDREQSWNKAADHCATVADPESVRLVSRHCLRQQAQSDLP